jgi:hypothetical protein
MKDEPLEAVYAFVERAYLRLQAGDLLIRCLEAGTSTPLQQMVEGLVLAGPRSLGILREILAESVVRRSQVVDDLHQVFSDFENSLKGYGVHLIGGRSISSVVSLSSKNFLRMLAEQGIHDDEAQVVCLQLLRDSRDLLTSLKVHIELLDEIEDYLEDWIWGLACQETKDQIEERRSGRGWQVL